MCACSKKVPSYSFQWHCARLYVESILCDLGSSAQGSKGDGIIQAKCKFVFKLNLMNSQVGNGGKVFNLLKVCQCLFNRLNIFLLDRNRNENSYP